MAGFIITTGRCGSTMLSRLLRDHPGILSLSGFLAALHSLYVPAFPADPVTGEQFWLTLTTPRPERQHCWNGEPGRNPGDQHGTPPLVAVALPFLTDEPGVLHEELGGYVRGLPRADCGTQYSRVFGWLCGRFGRRVWVERSGGSTWFLDDVLRCWPRARYVHLVRDGRNVAISMSQRPGFRLALLADQLQRQPGGPGGVSGAGGAGRLAMAAEAVAGSGEVPVERFGEVWSRQVVAAHERLSRLAPGQVLVLRYEDLAARPGPELARLAGFLDPGYEVPRGWLRASARQVERRRPAVSSLSGPQRARLEEACRPGLQILGYQ